MNADVDRSMIEEEGVTAAATISAIDYREGFGKNATGGAGYPVYVVTSSAATGAGTLYNAFLYDGVHEGKLNNRTIIFAVATATLPHAVRVGSNVTIDGMANGMDGVTLDVPNNVCRDLIVEGPANNVVIRGLNLRSNAVPSGGGCESDLLALDAQDGPAISDVFIDRCTFVQAADGALDITGNVSDVTVQRSMFYGNSHTMLIKYLTRQRISLHHNVFTHNGERNPQVRGDMRLIDMVNNVNYLNDVSNYSDGSKVDPYALRVWSAVTGSAGNVVGNFVNNAFIGGGTGVQLKADTGASLAGVYLSGNHCSWATSCPASPSSTPNVLPTGYGVTTTPIAQLGCMLPSIGAPNRTALDQQRMDAVAAVLPACTPPISSISDDFNDGVLSPIWSLYGDASYGETGGEAVLTPGRTNSLIQLGTPKAYALTGSQVSIKVPVMVSTVSGPYVYFTLKATNGNKVEFLEWAGSLQMRYWLNGTAYTQASVPYSSTTHKYWRIRESGGTTYWQTSDGTSWVTRAQRVNPINPAAVYLYIGAGTSGTVTSPGSAHFDELNMYP